MPKLLLKVVPALIFWGAFTFIIFNIPYPENLAEANLTHMALFLIALYLSLTFTFNIALRNIFPSLSIALGIILLLILRALDSLNIITGALVIISVGLLLSYFKKVKRKNLTKLPKIPKLTNLSKREK